MRIFYFMTMKIQLNGEQYLTQSRNLEGLLRELNVEPGRVAVELNMKIVKKDRFAASEISEGDQIEVVQFVGGGCDRIK